jgi:hypothetical protein
MARGTQLLQLIAAVREESNRASSVAVGVDDLPSLKQKIRRTQELLYDAYDWPLLREIFPLKPLQAGEQYYDFPTGLNLERVERVEVWYANLPRPLTRGISTREYAIYNSNNGVTQEPAMRWDVRWTGVKEQFEIWPIPSSNAQSIQFTGIRNLRPLIADGDVADLDDQMITLTVAAEILAKQGSDSAGPIGKAAMDRFTRMCGRTTDGGARTRRMGQGVTNQIDQRIPVVVHARASS